MSQPYQIEPKTKEAASARLAALFRSLLVDKNILASLSISVCLHILFFCLHVDKHGSSCHANVVDVRLKDIRLTCTYLGSIAQHEAGLWNKQCTWVSALASVPLEDFGRLHPAYPKDSLDTAFAEGKLDPRQHSW